MYVVGDLFCDRQNLDFNALKMAIVRFTWLDKVNL